MSDNPLVSVIIPTRDRPELAARAIRSALAQTYANQEIVVVDDASAVPLVLPPELADDNRVQTVRLDTASGAGRARNAGVRASQGTLLAFLDDDDRWRPAKIERQVQVLSGDGDAAAVETGYELWDGSRLVERYVPRPDRNLGGELLERPRMQPSTVLIWRSAFVELGGFDPTLLRVQDWDLWVRFADSYQAVALPEVLVDRDASDADAGLLLFWYRDMVHRLEPRIAPLPPGERSRIRATHLLVESSLLARLGKPKAARHKAWLALHEHPAGWWRPTLYMARTVIGERAWSTGKHAFQGVTNRTAAR